MNRRQFFTSLGTVGTAIAAPASANAFCFRRRKATVRSCPAPVRSIPDPPWNPFNNRIPFANYNRIYSGMSYRGTNTGWHESYVGHNLDERAYTGDGFAIDGGTVLFDQFSFIMTNNWNNRFADFAYTLTYDLVVPPGWYELRWYKNSGSSNVQAAGPAFRYVRMHVANLSTGTTLFDESVTAQANPNYSLPAGWTSPNAYAVSPRQEIRFSFVFWHGLRGPTSTQVSTGIGMRSNYFR